MVDEVECPRCVRGQVPNPEAYPEVPSGASQHLARMLMRVIDEGGTGTIGGRRMLARCTVCGGTGRTSSGAAATELLEGG